MRGAADLCQQPDRRWPFHGDVLCSLVARRTKRSKVGKFILAAKALVFDMADMQTYLSPRERVNVAGGDAAHLTGEAVAVKNRRPQFRRKITLEMYIGMKWRGFG